MNSSSTMSLSILLSLKDQASRALGGIGQAIAGLFTGNPQQLLAGIGQTLMAVGTAAVGFGVQSVQMASQYQQSMNMVQALTGTSGQQMQWYDGQLKSLAVNAGVAPNALAQGLYQVISAGYSGGGAMKVLTLSTEDSKIGMTDAATTADALTNILNAFSVGASGATVANGQMLETVTLGKSTFAQYASTITKASTTAAQFHISLATMSAAWATMTANSIRAKQASTDFVQVVQSMYGKVGTITTSLHKNGIAFNETAFNAANFKDKVLMLNTALQEAREKHISVTGVTLQAATAIQVISQHIGNYNSDLSTLSNKQQMAQKTQQAWTITQSGFAQTMSRVEAAGQVLMITIGQALLPILTRLMSQVAPLIGQFTAWIAKSGILNQVAGQLSQGVKFLIGAITPVIASFVHWISSGNHLQSGLSVVGNVVKQVGGFILQNLIQPIGHLISVVAPLVLGFANWAVKSGALKMALGFVAGALELVIKGAGWIINAAANIITFFVHSQAAAAALLIPLGALGGYMVFLAVSAIASFLSTLPLLLAGFALWAAGMIPVVIETLLTIGPYLLIGAIIGAVIFGIVEAVRHWGAIAHWLQGIWSAIIGWLGGAMNAIGSFFASIWNHIVAFFVGIWNHIVSIFKKYGLDILMVLIGPIGAIVILIVTHWNKVKAFLVTAWNDLVNLARTLWSDVTGVFTAAWDGISSALHSLWSKIWSLVTAWPGQMLALGGKIIQFLINGITGAIGGVKNAVGSVWHTISNFFPHSPPKEGPGTDLPNWGPRLVSQFGKGIEQSAPGLKASLGVLMTPVAQSLGAPQVGGGGVSGAQTAASGASAGGGITINLTVQARVIDRRTIKAIMEQIADELRSNGVLSSLATGGTH